VVESFLVMFALFRGPPRSATSDLAKFSTRPLALGAYSSLRMRLARGGRQSQARPSQGRSSHGTPNPGPATLLELQQRLALQAHERLLPPSVQQRIGLNRDIDASEITARGAKKRSTVHGGNRLCERVFPIPPDWPSRTDNFGSVGHGFQMLRRNGLNQVNGKLSRECAISNHATM
jgi:hypothetical protein